MICGLSFMLGAASGLFIAVLCMGAAQLLIKPVTFTRKPETFKEWKARRYPPQNPRPGGQNPGDAASHRESE